MIIAVVMPNSAKRSDDNGRPGHLGERGFDGGAAPRLNSLAPGPAAARGIKISIREARPTIRSYPDTSGRDRRTVALRTPSREPKGASWLRTRQYRPGQP